MLLDIHTHHKEGIPGENILNVEPGLFEPAEGCYYSSGIQRLLYSLRVQRAGVPLLLLPPVHHLPGGQA